MKSSWVVFVNPTAVWQISPKADCRVEMNKTKGYTCTSIRCQTNM